MGGVTYLYFNIWVFLPIREDVGKGEWFCTSQDQIGLRRPSGVLLYEKQTQEGHYNTAKQ